MDRQTHSFSTLNSKWFQGTDNFRKHQMLLKYSLTSRRALSVVADQKLFDSNRRDTVKEDEGMV